MACGCGSTTGQDCLCAIEGETGILVDGNGSSTFPYQVSPQLSGLSDNALQIAADGLYVPEVDVTDVACFEDGDGNPLPPEESGCIRVPQYAGILDYAGAPIAPNADNYVQLPTSGAPPVYGCGLTTTPDGTLIAGVSGTWPITPLSGPPLSGNDLTGGITYCDSNGQIRAAPQHTSLHVSGGTVTLYSGTQFINPNTTYNSPAYGSLTVTNPSPTRAMMTLTMIHASFYAAASPVGALEAHVERSVDGGGYNPVSHLIWWPFQGTPGPLITHEGEVTSFLVGSLAAGQTVSTNFRGVLANGSDASAVRYSVVMDVNILGWTR